MITQFKITDKRAKRAEEAKEVELPAEVTKDDKPVISPELGSVGQYLAKAHSDKSGDKDAIGSDQTDQSMTMAAQVASSQSLAVPNDGIKEMVTPAELPKVDKTPITQEAKKISPLVLNFNTLMNDALKQPARPKPKVQPKPSYKYRFVKGK